jgi:hypothetical protein
VGSVCIHLQNQKCAKYLPTWVTCFATIGGKMVSKNTEKWEALLLEADLNELGHFMFFILLNFLLSV